MVELCEHFKKFGPEVREYYVTSNEFRWNAWHEAEENGRVIYRSFVTGGILTYLLHLLKNSDCAIKVRLPRKKLIGELKKIMEEWEELQGEKTEEDKIVDAVFEVREIEDLVCKAENIADHYWRGGAINGGLVKDLGEILKRLIWLENLLSSIIPEGE